MISVFSAVLASLSWFWWCSRGVAMRRQRCGSCQALMRPVLTAEDHDQVCETARCAMRGYRVSATGAVEAWSLYGPREGPRRIDWSRKAAGV